ncbi:hypothetical protein [Actinoplanes sp. NPDC026623]|uniref:hypothetical protein n=1 Tax=Actinoplanes sp. NPDC026623 TaxID=3155610 RepID=UPI0034037E82
MTINAVNHLADVRVEMNPTERHLFSALATGLGYTPAALTADRETVTHLRAVAGIAARSVRVDLEEQLAELLFDAAHDACDDECVGGGRRWCERMARRLTDPGNPLADIADERERQDDRWGEQNPTPTAPAARTT